MINTQVLASAKLESNAASAEKDIVTLATPPSNVVAFCRSVLIKLLPVELLDSEETGGSNLQLLLRLVGEFIASRRRETLNMHTICQNFKVGTMC